MSWGSSSQEFLVGSKFSQTTLPALYEHGESDRARVRWGHHQSTIAKSNLRGASLLEMPWDDAVFRAWTALEGRGESEQRLQHAASAAAGAHQ